MASFPLPAFSQQFNQFAAKQLKELLESKHLYQKISITPTELMPHYKAYGEHIQAALQRKITVTDTPTVPHVNVIDLYLPVINVKLFCSSCGSREAFRPIWFSDITEQLIAKNKEHQSANVKIFKIKFPSSFQIISLVFQCQRCEYESTTFLIKREGTDLYIEGRSPIEHLELPNFLPTDEKKWFRDAVIAYQTGKTLAALFYLRTFMEQFARRMTGISNDKKTGDEIFTAYAGTLPESLRPTMPSLRDLYDKVSEAIHAANEDKPLFETTRQKIEEHFDIRRVHKLKESKLEDGKDSMTESDSNTKKGDQPEPVAPK